MEPLSRRTRYFYLGLFVVLFVVLIPIAILYASGYRLGSLSGFSLISTGGVYVVVPMSDAHVFLNGEEKGVSNIFNRTFYIDNLNAGSYAVHIAHEGSFPWYRTLVVESGIVTDVSALIIPQQIEPIRLMRASSTSTVSTTTKAISRAQFDAYMTSFIIATSTELKVKSTSTTTSIFDRQFPQDTKGGFELYVEDGNVRLHWGRATTSIPSALCITPRSCTHDIFIEKGKDTAIYARFWEGGIVYATNESGVYLSEIDVRPTSLVIPLYPRRNSEFRISSGSLIIKEGSALYQIDPF